MSNSGRIRHAPGSREEIENPFHPRTDTHPKQQSEILEEYRFLRQILSYNIYVIEIFHPPR
jgi:hypothetical protein